MCRGLISSTCHTPLLEGMYRVVGAPLVSNASMRPAIRLIVRGKALICYWISDDQSELVRWSTPVVDLQRSVLLWFVLESSSKQFYLE